MSKKSRSANSLENKNEYLKLFPNDKESKCEKMRFLALKEAQDIRKFEIELYWKRTGFFWAFITVIYTALFAVLCKYLECYEKYSFFVPIISTLSGLGAFFSLAWHMVNKGSKFWQKNWETHVSLLEKSEVGPLYDVFLNPYGTPKEWICPIKAFDFSVTKVNMWASFTIMICSFVGWIACLVWLFFFKQEPVLFVLMPSAFILLFSILMIVFSNGNSDIKIECSKESNINMIYIK